MIALGAKYQLSCLAVLVNITARDNVTMEKSLEKIGKNVTANLLP